ncbi:zinc-ribbon domain-containing protein [Candidatus Nomurabacteria bacterium]|nr:zinc-ribbon domain-containing protein [Candidatus Nomurabacteria bacterium]MCB9818018.1 zinc-ribbon domain-containing protein [Candidatus Nomurabacteria bacterium]
MNICNKCGEKNKAEASFCSKCGETLKQFKSKNSSIISRAKYVFMALLMFGLVVLGGYYFVDRQHQEDLEAVKNLVISGQYEEAIIRAEMLESSNSILSLMNEAEAQTIAEAIEEQRLCYLNKYPNYNSQKGIEDCVYWKRADELEKKEVWVNEYVQQEDAAYCRQISQQNEKECEVLRNSVGTVNWRTYGFCRWDPADSDPKCDYNSFAADKRDENATFLISQEWDVYMQQCTLERCPLPDELNF